MLRFFVESAPLMLMGLLALNSSSSLTSALMFPSLDDKFADALRGFPSHLGHDIGKDSDAGRDWGQEEKGTTEDEMAGWHHCLDGREFE